jgi:hypothetical protein
MGWKCCECDETAEKWGLCRWHYAYYMHPSNHKGEDESTTLGDAS